MHRYVATEEERERQREGEGERQDEPFVNAINPLNYSFIEYGFLYEYANVLNEIEIANGLSWAIRYLA